MLLPSSRTCTRTQIKPFIFTFTNIQRCTRLQLVKLWEIIWIHNDPFTFWQVSYTDISHKISHLVPFPNNAQDCFEKALSLQAGYQLSECVNVGRAANVMNIQVENRDSNYIKLRCITQKSVCYKYGQVGDFSRDCPYGEDDDNDTSSCIDQMHHSLVADLSVSAAILKILLKQLKNAMDARKA